LKVLLQKILGQPFYSLSFVCRFKCFELLFYLIFFIIFFIIIQIFKGYMNSFKFLSVYYYCIIGQASMVFWVCRFTWHILANWTKIFLMLGFLSKVLDFLSKVELRVAYIKEIKIILVFCFTDKSQSKQSWHCGHFFSYSNSNFFRFKSKGQKKKISRISIFINFHN